MSTSTFICETLYKGFRDYVPKKKLGEYDSKFVMRSIYNKDFAERFFPKYINFKTWYQKPKREKDALLMNYFLIEVPVEGLKRTKLLSRYLRRV